MCTTVRFLTRMQTHMSLQMVVTCKPFVTDFTLKRLFTCMSTFVILKYMFVTEATITSLASEHLILAIDASLEKNPLELD